MVGGEPASGSAQAFAFLKDRPLHSKVIPLDDAAEISQADEPRIYASTRDKSDTGLAKSVVSGPLQAMPSGELVKIFRALDEDSDGMITYAGFVDKLKRDRDLARRNRIHSSREIVEYANSIWNGKFGRTPSEGEMEEALYGRPPGSTMFETYSITWDTRSRLTVSRDDFLRHHQKLGPAVLAPPMDESVRAEKGHPHWHGLESEEFDDDDDDDDDPGEESGEEDWEAALRRSQEEEELGAGSGRVPFPVEVCVDLHCPARVGLRVRTSEWFKRSRGKYGWPDESMGSVGTITRICRVKDARSWHFSTCPLIKSSTAADLTIGDGIDKKSFSLMRERGVHKHWGSLPEKDPKSRSKILGDSVFHTQDAALSSTNTARPQAHLHGTDRVYQTHERLKLHKELFLDPWPLGGLVLSGVPADKPFSSKASQYWSMPHGWGQKHSQHWSHPGRNFAFPDVAAMDCQDAGFEEDEGRLVAFVEWDCGACGEYTLFECPYGDASLGLRALLVQHHKFSPAPTLLRPFCPKPVAQDMCSQSRYTSPNVFKVEAVGSDGRWELSYSCGEDAYVHTSWMVHASGGGNSMSIRRGFRAGACYAGNVERRQGDESTGGGMQGWVAAASLAAQRSEGEESASGSAERRAELEGGKGRKMGKEDQRIVTLIEDGASVQSPIMASKSAPAVGLCVHVADTSSGGCVVWGVAVQQIYEHSHCDAIEELHVGCRHIVARAADVSFFLESAHQPGERHALTLPRNGDTLDVSALVRGWRGFFVRAELECRAGFNADDSALLFGNEDTRGVVCGEDLTIRIKLKNTPTGLTRKIVCKSRPTAARAETVHGSHDAVGEEVDEERRAGAALRELRSYNDNGEGADEDVSRLLEVLSAVQRACSLEGVRAFVCRLGGAEMIASVMRARKGDVDVQRNAVRALGSMAAVLGVVGSAGGAASYANSFAEALQRDGSGGGWIVGSVLEAMKGHRKDASLQEQGCAFIAGVASMACAPLSDGNGAAQLGGPPSRKEEVMAHLNRSESTPESNGRTWVAVVMSEECLESVVRAMRAHVGAEAVQHGGCNAVWALLREGVCREARMADSLQDLCMRAQEVNDDRTLLGSQSIEHARSSCAEALLSALCRHKQNEAVCSKASWALWELCGGRHQRVSLSVNAKVPFGAALLALRGILPPPPPAHRDQGTQQLEALFQPYLAPLSLSALRASLARCTDRSADSEAARVCLEAMQAWEESEDVQEEACALLASLAAEAVVLQGGLRAVLRALRRHRGVDRVVIQGFCAVRHVASCKALMSDVSKVGCLGEVCEAARAHLVSEDVVAGALRVLGVFAETKNGANDVAMRGIVPTLEAAARRYRHGVEALLRSIKDKMQRKAEKPILVRASVHSKRAIGGGGKAPCVRKGSGACSLDWVERTRLEILLFEGGS